MAATLTLLGLCGSLRKDSYNRALLRALHGCLPDDVTLDIAELHGLPLFNQDEEGALPDAVADLKARIRATDGVVFACPEYNYSVPGVLKNAIDWCSRPVGESAWAGKPGAVLGASAGAFGTARAQLHLRQVAVGLDLALLAQPEVLVASAAQRFEGGELTHRPTRDVLQKFATAMVAWVRLVRGAQLGGS